MIISPTAVGPIRYMWTAFTVIESGATICSLNTILHESPRWSSVPLNSVLGAGSYTRGNGASEVAVPVTGSVEVTSVPFTMCVEPLTPASVAVQVLDTSPSGERAANGSLSSTLYTVADELTDPVGPVVPSVRTVIGPRFSKM
jgi:hypothetical protein